MAKSTQRCLRLLGPVRIERIQGGKEMASEDGTDKVPSFRSYRTMALLGYLVTERRPVARDFLAAFLWPDKEPGEGLTSLRRELYNLSQLLPECWSVDAKAVAFVSSTQTKVDLYTLLDLVAEERWEKAAELLAGEFLEGLYLPNNLEIEHWLQIEREKWRAHAEDILAQVINASIRRGQYPAGLRYALRRVQLSPWEEEAHRQAMQLLAWTGKRGAALRQFEACKRVLWQELTVKPAPETLQLKQQIEAGELDPPRQLPAFLTVEAPKQRSDRSAFVAREGELARLGSFLDEAMSGRGRMIFVTGSPGRGKTALLQAFARQAMEAHSSVLVANGRGSAYAGIGDPYLPFREAMTMLAGDVEAKWEAGAISRAHARRLWDALPLVAEALLEHGPALLDVLVPSEVLLSRITLGTQMAATAVAELNEHIRGKERHSRRGEQRYLAQQLVAVLKRVAEVQPLLLLLDDVQWADAASISLLFHLAPRLVDSRVLIACAYRPEEVALVRDGERHPLAKALSEFKLAFGDVWIELDRAEGVEARQFVDALLDSEPNRLGEEFRSTLFQRTAGHPLFTSELLRTMKQRGDLVRNEEQQWSEGATLDWNVVPARVEAVIAERLERLEPELQEILTVASVEGELFTAQVVAEVQQMDEERLLRRLSRGLERRHRLVKEEEELHTGVGQLSRYRFGHILFQEHLYRGLSAGERRLLHGDVAVALEKLYAGQREELAVQLGHHFHHAGAYERALPYFTGAAQRAARIHANDEAIGHYTKAIELANRIALESLSLAELHRGRGLVRRTVGEFDGARADLEKALNIADKIEDQQLHWRLLLDAGKLWASRDYLRTRRYFEAALERAQEMTDPEALAGSLNWIGNWHANAEDPEKAVACHKEALAIFEQLGDEEGRAKTLDLLGITHLLSGDHAASVNYYDQAIPLLRELGHYRRLLSSLIARGTNGSLLVLLATPSAISPSQAHADIEEAMHMARRLHSPPEEAWACWSMGLLHTVSGELGDALNVMKRGLQISVEVGHHEWGVGNRFALGVYYVAVLMPELARGHLEQALAMAEGLQSRYWINHVTGALAAAHILNKNLRRAQICLESVLSPEIPMNTMGKRYCWVRRAELALAQNEAQRALNITNSLIASATDADRETVMPFVWMLKGEALAALERPQEAGVVLRTALSAARRQGQQILLWRIHASLGKFHLALGQSPDAEQEYGAARAHVEKLAETVPDAALKKALRERAGEW